MDFSHSPCCCSWCSNVIVYMQFQKPFLAINITLSAFFTYFRHVAFSDPRRVVEIDDPSPVVAPADGAWW